MQGYISSGGSRENLFSFLFQLLDIIYIPWLMDPSFIFKARLQLLPSSLTSPILSSPEKSWVIFYHKIRQKSAELIHNFKVSWECKVTYSQVPEIRIWTSLGRHYSTYHKDQEMYSQVKYRLILPNKAKIKKSNSKEPKPGAI